MTATATAPAVTYTRGTATHKATSASLESAPGTVVLTGTPNAEGIAPLAASKTGAELREVASSERVPGHRQVRVVLHFTDGTRSGAMAPSQTWIVVTNGMPVPFFAEPAAPAAEVTEDAPADEPAAGHRISWFVYLEEGVRTRYSARMTGDLPAWDLSCSCGWDSRTGGATKGAVRKMMAAHKAEHSA